VAEVLGEDLMALRSKLKPLGEALPTKKKSAAAIRHDADRKSMMAEGDGRRSRRAVQRDEQINFKVPKGTKARVQSLALALDISMVEAFERAIEMLEATLTEGGEK
jgi:hypothetical protein